MPRLVEIATLRDDFPGRADKREFGQGRAVPAGKLRHLHKAWAARQPAWAPRKRPSARTAINRAALPARGFTFFGDGRERFDRKPGNRLAFVPAEGARAAGRMRSTLSGICRRRRTMAEFRGSLCSRRNRSPLHASFRESPVAGLVPRGACLPGRTGGADPALDDVVREACAEAVPGNAAGHPSQCLRRSSHVRPRSRETKLPDSLARPIYVNAPPVRELRPA